MYLSERHAPLAWTPRLEHRAATQDFGLAGFRRHAAKDGVGRTFPVASHLHRDEINAAFARLDFKPSLVGAEGRDAIASRFYRNAEISGRQRLADDSIVDPEGGGCAAGGVCPVQIDDRGTGGGFETLG